MTEKRKFLFSFPINLKNNHPVGLIKNTANNQHRCVFCVIGSVKNLVKPGFVWYNKIRSFYQPCPARCFETIPRLTVSVGKRLLGKGPLGGETESFCFFMNRLARGC